MASYAQIAQYSFSVGREDGTTKTFQMTFEEKSGSALSLDVPHTSDLVITHGEDNDGPTKPVKVSQAEFTLKGANSTLIDKITEAGLRDIRVTIDETGGSTEEFKGYVVRALDTVTLYKDTKEVRVRCIGALGDLTGVDVDAITDRTLYHVVNDALTDIDLPRPIDFYSSLDHTGRSGTNGMPQEIRFDERVAAGPSFGPGKTVNGVQDGKSTFDAIKGFQIPLGWQIFQDDGRMVIMDLYDRVFNRSAVTKWQDDGTGTYTQTTEDVRFSLDETSVVAYGDITELVDVTDYDHSHSFLNRSNITDITKTSTQTVSKDSELSSQPDDGMVREGDTIEIDSCLGALTLNTDPGSNLTGDVGFLRVVLFDRVSGNEYHYDPDAPSGAKWKEGSTKHYWTQSYSFAAGGGAGQEISFGISDEVLEDPPDGIIADIFVYRTNKLLNTSGGTTEINGADHDELTVKFIEDQPGAGASRVYRGQGSPSVGKKISNSFFIGDEDQYFDQSFLYDDGTPTSRTSNWDDGTRSGLLGNVVGERLARLLTGSGIEFTVVIRDTTRISLKTAFQIDDNDGVVRVCYPIRIRHITNKGYYQVRLREAFDGFSSMGRERYSGDVSTSLGGVSGSSTGGGGGLTESDADNLYLKLDGSNDPMSGALDMGGNNISNVARLLATEVEIDGDWQLRTQTPGSVNRLFVDPITADSNVEIFVAPSGTATSAALTLADGSNQTNYEGIEIAADDVTNRITSLTEGTGTIRELQIRVDGNEDLSLWRDSTKYIDLVSGGVTVSQALTAQGGIESGGNILLDANQSILDLHIRPDGAANEGQLSLTGRSGTNALRTVIFKSLGGTGTTRDLRVTADSAEFDADGASNFDLLLTGRSGTNVKRTVTLRSKGGAGTTADLEVLGDSAVLDMDVDITGNLAVNKTGATEALDVNGNILTSGTLTAQTALTVNTSSLTAGFIADFNGDVLVQGLLDAETIQTQTLRTTLFKPTTISGMGGEIAFSAVSTVVSIDTANNDIVVEDAVFANGDSVVVSSAIYNQSGFSNVELNITSAGSAVTGGTEYSYTVNSGSETDIDTGDSVTRINGDLVYINATKGSGSPLIAGYDNLSGFSDSPLSGDTASPIWKLEPTGGVIGGFNIDNQNLINDDGSLEIDPVAGINLESPFGITGYSSISWFKSGNFGDQDSLTAYVQGEYFSGDDQSTLNLKALNAGTTIVDIGADEIHLGGGDIVVPSDLPTSDPVSAGKLFTQTATQLGGSGTEKVLCVSEGGTPSAPSQPSVCKQSNALVISWPSEPGADNYEVQYRTGGSGTFTNLDTTSNTSISDTAPSSSPDTTYEYRVRACNINGCSAYSTESADTTYNTASSC